MIYQERSLIGHLTVAENIYLGHEPHRLPGLPIIDRGRSEAGAQALLDRLDLPIDPRADVRPAPDRTTGGTALIFLICGPPNEITS